MSPAAVVCLVGMPGSGKSTVGRLLAARLGRRFVDLDEVVERRAGMSIPEVFAHEGEAGFRRREHRELVELLACSEDLVVAGGGGLVTHPPSRDALSGACCVWLRADPGDLVARVGPGGGDRPLLAADPRNRLEELAAERAPLYGEVADLVVDTSGRRPGEVVDAIVEAW